MIRSIARALPTLLVLTAACADRKPDVLKFEVKNVNVRCTPLAGSTKATCVVSADAVTAARRPFQGVVAVMDGDTVLERAIVPLSSGSGTYRAEKLETATTTPRISVTALGILVEPVNAAASVTGVTTTCDGGSATETASVQCTARGQVQYSDKPGGVHGDAAGNYLAVVEVKPSGASPIHAFVRLQAGVGSFSVEWNNGRAAAAPPVEVAALGIVAKDPG